MPKMKSRSGAKKRVKLTASGKVKHKKQNLRHILTKKTPKRKRHLRQHSIIDSADAGRIREMLNQ